MPILRRLAVVAVLPCAALALTGCTKTVRASDVESKVARNLQRELPGRTITVDCPGGKKAEKGTTFSCEAKIDGKPAIADIRLETAEKFSFRIRRPGAK